MGKETLPKEESQTEGALHEGDDTATPEKTTADEDVKKIRLKPYVPLVPLFFSGVALLLSGYTFWDNYFNLN
jgi:hypothetical protein